MLLGCRTPGGWTGSIAERLAAGSIGCRAAATGVHPGAAPVPLLRPPRLSPADHASPVRHRLALPPRCLYGASLRAVSSPQHAVLAGMGAFSQLAGMHCSGWHVASLRILSSPERCVLAGWLRVPWIGWQAGRPSVGWQRCPSVGERASCGLSNNNKHKTHLWVLPLAHLPFNSCALQGQHGCPGQHGHQRLLNSLANLPSNSFCVQGQHGCPGQHGHQRLLIPLLVCHPILFVCRANMDVLVSMGTNAS